MKLFTHIKHLYQVRPADVTRVNGLSMNDLPTLNDAWLAVKDGRIAGFGEMMSIDRSAFSAYEEVNLDGRSVLPTWVDGHTHLVFAAWRNQEFEDRIQGLSYQEIAARGGGILNSADRLAHTSEDELFESALKRLHALISQGTGAIEIKSGYGLSVEAELKMLRVIRRLKEASPIPIKATFLGAHAFPSSYQSQREAYVDLIIDEMLPVIHKEGLADYIDVFCEEGYFSVAQTERILNAGKAYGLKAKVHVNQFNAIGGIALCTKQGALSVDHLEVLEPEDLEALKKAATIPVALPSCSFFLGIPYTPAKDLMHADLPLALASDFNPGSTPSGNMNFVFSLACIQMKMTPAEAVNAMTINAAASIELSNELGTITEGKLANFIVTNPMDELSFMPYAFGDSHIEEVYIEGARWEG